MTGPHDSVIGVEREAILQRFLTALPQRFETATENPRLNAVIIAADETTGLANSIERLSLSQQDIEALVAAPLTVR
jgi:calcineurin-like phosphoesterase